MLRKAMLLPILVLLPAAAMAVDNVGTCGWGSKLFEGDRGIAPQVLAATTNGSSGNQTFAITSGTSGCTKDGVVNSNWKTVMFIEENTHKLARDISAGRGETLDALANLLGMEESAKPVFFKAAQASFSDIFPHEDITSREVAANLRRVLLEQESLSRFASAI